MAKTTSGLPALLGFGLLAAGAGLISLAPLPWTFAGFVLAAAGIAPAVEGWRRP